jgi:hypothetical protein
MTGGWRRLSLRPHGSIKKQVNEKEEHLYYKSGICSEFEVFEPFTKAKRLVNPIYSP